MDNQSPWLVPVIAALVMLGFGGALTWAIEREIKLAIAACIGVPFMLVSGWVAVQKALRG